MDIKDIGRIKADDEMALRILKEKAIMSIEYAKVRAFTRIEDKALYVADHLLSDVENFDGYYASINGEEESEEIKLLNKLYAVIHSSLTCHRCFDSHEKWRKETEDMFDAIVKEETGP